MTGTTGIAKQTGEFVYDTTIAIGYLGSNFVMHSQGNAIVYNGVTYIQTTNGYQPTSDKIDTFTTFVSFGSPMNGKDMGEIIKSMGYTYLGAYTKAGDFVGETLGGNIGNNQQATILEQANLLNIVKLFTNSSPHSTYICQDFGTNVKCGYRP